MLANNKFSSADDEDDESCSVDQSALQERCDGGGRSRREHSVDGQACCVY